VVLRVGRSIALLFDDRGTRREWVVSSTTWPQFKPWKDPVPIVQEAGWAPGPVWTGGKSRPHRDSVPDRPARSQWLYHLNYPAHSHKNVALKISDELNGKLALILCRYSAKIVQRGSRISVHYKCFYLTFLAQSVRLYSITM